MNRRTGIFEFFWLVVNIGLNYHPPSLKIISRFSFKGLWILKHNWLDIWISSFSPSFRRGRSRRWWCRWPCWQCRWPWWLCRWSWCIILRYFVRFSAIITAITSSQKSRSIFSFFSSMLSSLVRNRRPWDSWSSTRMYIAWLSCNVSTGCIPSW